MNTESHLVFIAAVIGLKNLLKNGTHKKITFKKNKNEP